MERFNSKCQSKSYPLIWSLRSLYNYILKVLSNWLSTHVPTTRWRLLVFWFDGNKYDESQYHGDEGNQVAEAETDVLLNVGHAQESNERPGVYKPIKPVRNQCVKSVCAQNDRKCLRIIRTYCLSFIYFYNLKILPREWFLFTYIFKNFVTVSLTFDISAL